MAQPVILHYEPFSIVNLPVGSVAIEIGDFVSYESGALVIVDAVTEDATFMGIAMGNVDTTKAGELIPVAQRCIIKCDLSSAAYEHSAPLDWTSANLLSAAGAGATIAWKWGDDSGTITAGDVLIDVFMLSGTASKPYLHT